MPLLHDPAVRAALEARLSALRPDSPRQWGTMTVDQMLWHVNEFLASAIGEGSLPAQKNSMPLLRPLMRIMLLYAPWPKSVRTNPGAVAHDRYDFDAERARCRALIAKFVNRPIDGPWPVDPTFGAATGTFASKLQARHLDHHFKQSAPDCVSRTATYVALVRGVNNIGMTKRVAMADLRALCERLGFRDVRTVMNSGNVILSAPAGVRAGIPARIAKGLASRLGVESPVTLLSAREVEAVVRENPFPGAHPSDLLVLVPRTRAGLLRLRPLLDQRWRPESLALGSRVAYLWCAKGVARSPVWAAADKALERSGTVRNIGTFTRIANLLGGRA